MVNMKQYEKKNHYMSDNRYGLNGKFPRTAFMGIAL